MQFYDRIDIPFRRFLETADASDDYDKINERLNAWHNEQRKIAFELAEEEIAGANPSAFFGRTVQEKVKQKTVKVHYSLSEAYDEFKKWVNLLLKE